MCLHVQTSRRWTKACTVRPSAQLQTPVLDYHSLGKGEPEGVGLAQGLLGIHRLDRLRVAHDGLFVWACVCM